MNTFISLIINFLEHIFETEVFIYYLLSTVLFGVVLLVLRLAKGFR